MDNPQSLPPELANTIKIGRWQNLINWKSITLAITLLFGGGGIAAWDIVSKDDVQQKIDTSIMHYRAQEDARHIRLDFTIEQQGSDLTAIKRRVEEVQSVQHKQIAREEARRLTCNIKNRLERERIYDALVDLNLKRLRNGGEPCQTLNCND